MSDLLSGWGRGAWGSGAWNQGSAVEVTGVAGTGAAGNVTSDASSVFAVTGSVGNTTETGTATFAVTGNSITATLGTGTVAPIQSIGVFPTGVLATGAVGEEVLYREIIPSQTPNWAGVTVSQTPNWTDIAA